MSFWATTWAFEQETGPSGAKFVLVALASFADQEGFAYPTQERLAAMTNQGARTVRRHLEELEAAGAGRAAPPSEHDQRAFQGRSLPTEGA